MPTATSRHRRARGAGTANTRLAVGVWAGNSNSSPVTTVSNPVFSLDVAAPVWDAFLTDVTRTWEVRDFIAPVRAQHRAGRRLDGLPALAILTPSGDRALPPGTSPDRDPYIGADGGGEGRVMASGIVARQL